MEKNRASKGIHYYSHSEMHIQNDHFFSISTMYLYIILKFPLIIPSMSTVIHIFPGFYQLYANFLPFMYTTKSDPVNKLGWRNKFIT
jgi:hypothetical protein